MQKWEYLYVSEITYDDTITSEYIVNGALDDRHKDKQVWALSNELGEEGWEMVSSFANYRTPQHSPATLWTLVFKRPKP